MLMKMEASLVWAIQEQHEVAGYWHLSFQTLDQLQASQQHL
jgi:hypothetical protein